MPFPSALRGLNPTPAACAPVEPCARLPALALHSVQAKIIALLPKVNFLHHKPTSSLLFESWKDRRSRQWVYIEGEARTSFPTSLTTISTTAAQVSHSLVIFGRIFPSATLFRDHTHYIRSLCAFPPSRPPRRLCSLVLPLPTLLQSLTPAREPRAQPSSPSPSPSSTRRFRLARPCRLVSGALASLDTHSRPSPM